MGENLKLKDLDGLTTTEAREILMKAGANFEPIPEVDLGNLRYPDNIHASWYISETPWIHRRQENGSIRAVILGGFDPNWDIDSCLIVKSMDASESLMRYAKAIREEYADLDDKQLMEFRSIGEKRFARARDECLRRKLITKVGEGS